MEHVIDINRRITEIQEVYQFGSMFIYKAVCAHDSAANVFTLQLQNIPTVFNTFPQGFLE